MGPGVTVKYEQTRSKWKKKLTRGHDRGVFCKGINDRLGLARVHTDHDCPRRLAGFIVGIWWYIIGNERKFNSVSDVDGIFSGRIRGLEGLFRVLVRRELCYEATRTY